MQRALTVLLVLVLASLIMPTDAAAQPASGSSAGDAPLTPAGFDLQGHRGARGLAPENTLPAFRKALDLGVTTLEMDVVISQDGRVVVSHEPWMNPAICTTPNGERIPDDEAQSHALYRMPYAEIAAYDCGSLQHPRFPEQEPESAKKPLLSEVIAMAEEAVDLGGRDRPVFYNIETKSRPSWEGAFHPDPKTFAQAVVDVVEDAGVARRATVQSFDPRTLRGVHRMDVPVRTALLVARSQEMGLAGALGQLGFTPHIYSPDHRLVTERLLRKASERGVQVIPWTVNAPDRMQHLVALGVDGLITDYPNRALSVVPRNEAE